MFCFVKFRDNLSGREGQPAYSYSGNLVDPSALYINILGPSITALYD